ncbi:hypothetical protein LIER_07793 [Lithospermum erythrorhizon]|uniref:Reverse transcriptase zinc-binding domain-containing protein n=1 Tax=Lithospermum erythrorhizon TaxID=34254 RepID=A0AAV3P9L2_LITER
MAKEKDPTPTMSAPNTGLWNRLWKWKLPRKVKHFLWRVYVDTLPTGDRLVIQNMCFSVVRKARGLCIFFNSASACDQELLYRWLVSIWEVWHQRNKALHGEAIRQPMEVVEFDVEYLAKTSRAAAMMKFVLSRLFSTNVSSLMSFSWLVARNVYC